MGRRRSPIPRILRRLGRDARGATAIEYGLICALIVVTMMAAFIEFAHTTTGLWGNVADKVTRAGAP